MDDSSLLKAFATTGDERAFRALVDRHVDLVYSAARRQVRDAHLAEDVAQAVFVVLARRAARVRSAAALPAWLLTTTKFVARDAIRSERRRRTRERQAAQAAVATMTELTRRADTPDWQRIEPILDDALARLRERDRVLVTLRFLQGMSLPAVAASTGLSTKAAQ